MAILRTKAFRLVVEGATDLILDSGTAINNPQLNRLERIRDRSEKEQDELDRVRYRAACPEIINERPALTPFFLKKPFLETARNNRHAVQRLKELLFINSSVIIDHSGPPTVDELFEYEDFGCEFVRRETGQVVIVPRFPDWSFTFELRFDPNLLSVADATNIVHAASAGSFGHLRQQGYGKFKFLKADLIDVSDEQPITKPSFGLDLDIVERLAADCRAHGGQPSEQPEPLDAQLIQEDEGSDESIVHEQPVGVRHPQPIAPDLLKLFGQIICHPQMRSNRGLRMWVPFVSFLNERNICTATGLEWTEHRLRSIVKNRFDLKELATAG